MNVAQGPGGRPSRRRAVALTVLILVVVLGLLLAFALTMTRRLVDEYRATDPATATTPVR